MIIITRMTVLSFLFFFTNLLIEFSFPYKSALMLLILDIATSRELL